MSATISEPKVAVDAQVAQPKQGRLHSLGEYEGK